MEETLTQEEKRNLKILKGIITGKKPYYYLPVTKTGKQLKLKLKKNKRIIHTSFKEQHLAIKRTRAKLVREKNQGSS